MRKIEPLVCREHGTEKKSEFPTGIEPMTSRTPTPDTLQQYMSAIVMSANDGTTIMSLMDANGCSSLREGERVLSPP